MDEKLKDKLCIAVQNSILQTNKRNVFIDIKHNLNRNKILNYLVLNFTELLEHEYLQFYIEESVYIYIYI